jgi:hypothetical protein
VAEARPAGQSATVASLAQATDWILQREHSIALTHQLQRQKT